MRWLCPERLLPILLLVNAPWIVHVGARLFALVSEGDLELITLLRLVTVEVSALNLHLRHGFFANVCHQSVSVQVPVSCFLLLGLVGNHRHYLLRS